MAEWDTDYCVQRCQDLALRPSNDEMMSTAKWARLLTLAEEHWLPVFLTHVPESQMGEPVALTLASDSKTAAFPAGVYPMGRVELYDGLAGRRLVPGNYNDPAADFVIESDGAGGMRLRAPLDRTFSFPNGLYARYADTQTRDLVHSADGAQVNPRLQPPHARVLLVYHALALYSSMGGYMDPSYWEHLQIAAAFDDPQTGKVGIITSLKTQFQDQGADSGHQYVWWRSSDLNNLRHRLV